MIVTVVNGGLGNPSSTGMLADRLTEAVSRELAARGEAGSSLQVRRVDVREHAHAIVDALLAGFPSGALARALADVGESDALVLVTPTFQASYAGLFKAFLDLVPADSLRGAPVLVAATGGTQRHSLVLDHALRPLVAYLGGVSVPTGVYAATQDFGSDAALERRITAAADQLATLLSGASVRQRPADAYADVTPFEELLRRVQP